MDHWHISARSITVSATISKTFCLLIRPSLFTIQHIRDTFADVSVKNGRVSWLWCISAQFFSSKTFLVTNYNYYLIVSSSIQCLLLSVISCIKCQWINEFVTTGVLACLDGYMNIALEQTEEYVNGQLKNKYGDAFIRGNNGMYNLVLHTYNFL